MGKLNGLRRHPICAAWYHMRQRCETKSCNEYKYYGARGIKVCDEWKDDFLAFYEWSKSNGWEKGLSLDRIDVDGDYEPSNCRWVTMEVQQNNKRNNCFITYNGKTQTYAQWARELGLNRSTITRRLAKGWTPEQIVTTPSKKYKYNERKRQQNE